MKKHMRSPKIITGTALAIFVAGMLLSIFGLSLTVADIDTALVVEKPEAVLANAGVTEETTINLPVDYYDQRADACVNMYDAHASKALATRQFEWTECGYYNKKIEQGIVDYQLGENYLPVAVGGKMDSNLGLNDMTRWFSAVEGKSKAYSRILNLDYRQKDIAEFSYANNDFYPLDGADFSKGDKANTDGHNHLFTMSLAIPFVVATSGSETFEIAADDDTFVYIDDKLAIDMGGIHGAATGKMAINEQGEVYTSANEGELAYSGIQVTKGSDSVIRIFHADRDSTESVFRLKITGMSLNVINTQLANADGVQVAYDPSNPGYVAPLGETITSMPDTTKGRLLAVTILGMMVVVCAIFAAMMAHTMVKSHRNKTK